MRLRGTPAIRNIESANEESAIVVKDITEHKNDAKMLGKPEFVDGKLGKSIPFDGSSSIEVKHNDSLSMTVLKTRVWGVFSAILFLSTIKSKKTIY